MSYFIPPIKDLTITGNIGIGTNSPGVQLSTKGRISVFDASVGEDLQYNGGLVITRAAASGQYINLVRSGVVPWSIGTVYNTSTFGIGIGSLTDSNWTATFFNIDSSGKVGIGTSAPVSILDVYKSSGYADLRVRSGSSQAFIAADSSYVNLGTYSNVPMLFTTNNTERMRIDASGYVGIGTSSPATPLHVYAASSDNFKLETSSSTYYNRVYFSNGSRSWTAGQNNGNDFWIADETASAIRLAITSSGNVGIGTGSPASKLDVVGKMRAAGVNDSLDVQNIVWHGGAGDVEYAYPPTDNVAAWNAAIAACQPTSPQRQLSIYFPPGNYYFSTSIEATFGGDQYSHIIIIGAGAGVTKLTFGSGGINLTMTNPQATFHIRDLEIMTMQRGASTGLYVNNVNSGAIMASNFSDITNVSFHGADGWSFGPQRYHWGAGIHLMGVMCVNYYNVTVAGPEWGTTADGYVVPSLGIGFNNEASCVPTTGVGIFLDCALGAVGDRESWLHNFVGCNFINLGVGARLGQSCQGITFNQTNWAGCYYCIHLPSVDNPLHNDTDQIAVIACQLNGTFGIIDQIGCPTWFISNNYFYIRGAPWTGGGFSPGIYIEKVGKINAQTGGFTITGNNLMGGIDFNTTNGIVIGDSQSYNGWYWGGVITGNVFNRCQTGLWLQAGSYHVNVQSNHYSNNGTNLVNSGTINTIGGGSY